MSVKNIPIRFKSIEARQTEEKIKSCGSELFFQILHIDEI